MSVHGLQAAEGKMRAGAQSEEAIAAFGSAYQRLVGGESAMLASSELEPAADVPSLDDLPELEPSAALEHVVVIKLNGGLATTMGLRSPKSLLEARDGRSFLDLIIGQTLALRGRYGVRLPLLLMNSQATRKETLEALARYPDLNGGLPVEFMQSMVPKVDAESLDPVT
jgi:UTP--glucose-1-phosphate uridylyltransferase